MKTENYSKYLAFIISVIVFIVYLVTVSHTVNFWDSGELIASADKLQISHAPGAPLYTLISRLFIVLSFGLINKALAVNLVSVVSATLTVFFTFKITYLLVSNFASKFYGETFGIKKIKLISSISAIIASLSLAFSKSFWSLATEAEVYSLSMFFTSLIVWLIFKFFYNKEIKEQNRLTILISLLFGLALGVHQLNILVLPVWILVLWIKYSKINFKKLLAATIISLLSIIAVLYLLDGTLFLLSFFEKIFVNSFNFPINSGVYFFIFILFLFFSLGIYLSGIKNKPTHNLIFTCLFFFYLGFSVYLIIPIRSAANPLIDQNNPENIFSFISYYEREQFGERPLLYGQQFNSSLDKSKPYVKGDAIWDTVNGRYEIISYKPKANYRKEDKRVLPRMWSNLPKHVAAYREWTKYYSDDVPNFYVNAKFLFRYQISHMYIRYFLWNFAGKQNDFQSHGGPVYGNWTSGIPLFDKIRLGTNNNLPDKFKNNPASDNYYMLPLILGLIGFIALIKKDKKLSLILFILFFISGIAITLYLNQHPYQVRERDYVYLGSFYVFCILIGFSVPAIYSFAKNIFKSEKTLSFVGILIFIAAPGQFLIKNFDDSNKSNNKIAYEFAYNLLNSCDKNAILFVSGDNETFPLWYLQCCENIRQDVSIINVSYLNTDWYIDQIRTRRSKPNPVLQHLNKRDYISGQKELLLVKNNIFAFIEDIYSENSKEINEDFSAIINYFDKILLESGFNRIRPSEYQNFKEIYAKAKPYGADSDFVEFNNIVRSLNSEERCQLFGIPLESAKELNRMLDVFLEKQRSYPIPLNACLNFVFSNNEATKIETKLYDYPIDYFPANKLSLSINKNHLLNYINAPELEKYIVNKMVWNLNYESITKGELMIYEIIFSNMWQRPIYFSSLMNSRNFMGLEKYLFLEGLAYKLIPIETEISVEDPVNVNALKMYDNIKNRFIFNSLKNNTATYYDENTRNILVNLRNHFSKLARALYFSGEINKSDEVLDLIVELIPNEKIPFDYYMNGIIHAYYRINKYEKAGQIADKTIKNAYDELFYYSQFPLEKRYSINSYINQTFKTIEEIYLLSKTYGDRKQYLFSQEYYNKAKQLKIIQ